MLFQTKTVVTDHIRHQQISSDVPESLSECCSLYLVFIYLSALRWSAGYTDQHYLEVWSTYNKCIMVQAEGKHCLILPLFTAQCHKLPVVTTHLSILSDYSLGILMHACTLDEETFFFFFFTDLLISTPTCMAATPKTISMTHLPDKLTFKISNFQIT